MAQLLKISDPWVQDFIWSYLVPEDIKEGFTKLDALTSIARDVISGDQYLIGDKEAGVIFRCVLRNPKLLEVHVMGNGLRLRSVAKECLPLGWALGVERMIAYTQYPTLAKLWQKIGLKLDACIPKAHLQGNELVDIYVLSLERPTHETRTSVGNP